MLPLSRGKASISRMSAMPTPPPDLPPEPQLGFRQRRSFRKFLIGAVILACVVGLGIAIFLVGFSH
jgi:hypothetical protein